MNSLRFFKNRLILSLPPQDSTSPVPPQFFTEEPQPCPAPRKTLVLPTYQHSIPRGQRQGILVAEVSPSQALLLYTNHQFRSGFVKLLLSSTASLGAVRSSEPTGHLLLEVCRRDQILPLPFGARKMQRRGEGEGDKVPVRAPLTSSWLSKRQQLIAGVAGWGGET